MYYLLFIRPFKSSVKTYKFFLWYWDAGFMPVPTSIGAIETWGVTWQSFLQYIGYPLPWAVFITGLVAVSVVDAMRNRRPDGLSFVLTIVATLVASALHRYPLRDARTTKWPASAGRLILFLAPLLYLLSVRGLQILVEQKRRFISLLLTTLLLVPSLYSALDLLNNPIVRAEMRPVLKYLSDHQQPDDRVYVHYRADNTVKYYQWYVRLPDRNVHWGRYPIRDQERFIQEIEYLKQWPRVWLLFARIHEDEKIIFLSNIKGKLLDQYHVLGVSLYLYNFEHR
jgi:hypothetical protein